MITFLLWTYDDIYWNKRIKKGPLNWIENEKSSDRFNNTKLCTTQWPVKVHFQKKKKNSCSFCRTSLLMPYNRWKSIRNKTIPKTVATINSSIFFSCYQEKENISLSKNL
jgi:hypothetical protein